MLIHQKKKNFMNFTSYLNPRTSIKDKYIIQVKLEDNKIQFTAEKKDDIIDIKYVSISSFGELKQNKVLNLFN